MGTTHSWKSEHFKKYPSLIKVASKLLKIEYVIGRGMSIYESGILLYVSKLLWVYNHLKSEFFSEKKSSKIPSSTLPNHQISLKSSAITIHDVSNDIIKSSFCSQKSYGNNTQLKSFITFKKISQFLFESKLNKSSNKNFSKLAVRYIVSECLSAPFFFDPHQTIMGVEHF